MKIITKTALVLGIAALAATTAVASSNKVDTLQFNIKVPLTDTGVEPGSGGTVSGSEVRQHGTVNQQKLDVTVTGLTASTTYSLDATTSGGTTDLLDFDTDGNGSATLHFHGGKGKLPKNATALPDGFEVVQITSLDVVNGGSQSVLTTDGSTPTSFKFMAKRDISSDVATGMLQINATTKGTKFSLTASGLDANTDYELFINGALDSTITSDSKGKLKIKAATTLPTNILDLSSVELRDSTGTTTILSTSLP